MRYAWLALLIVGCGAPLGTDDVELRYTGTVGEWDVEYRLAMSSIEAEVEPTPDGIAIRLEAQLADPAVQLLAWPGGLAVERVEPGIPVLAQLAVMHDPKAHAEGTQIVVTDRVATTTLAREPPDTIVMLSFAGHRYWRGPLREVLAGDAIRFPRGDTIAAYEYARRTARMIATPTLPELRLVHREELPVDWPLAIGCLVLPLIVGVAWIFFIRRFDRARPEPWWLLLATFAIGGASQLVAGWIEVHLMKLSPYLDFRSVGLDLAASRFPLSLLVCMLVVGFVEEGAKLLAAWGLAMHRREFDEPVDGIVFATVAAIGFATFENIKYFTHYRFGDAIDATRSLECVSGHLMYAALWGYALGQRLVARKPRVVRWFLLAALLHALWDTTLTFSVPHAQLVITLISVALFVIVLRRALRWGVIESSGSAGARSDAERRGEPIERDAKVSSEREHFAVGRRGAFVLAILSMYGFGYQLVELGLRADRAGARVTTQVLLWSAIYGSLFVIAAWGVARLMPLDVAVDDTGVTFAGAQRRWSAITGATRAEPWTLVLHGEGGDLRLGPGSRAVIDRLEATIQKRIVV